MKSYDPGQDPKWHYGVALLIGFVITTFFVWRILPYVYLARDSDASFYIEVARNFLAGKGLVMSARLDQLPLITQPLSEWPPGFPIIIAFWSKILGVDPAWVAPRIDWVSWALLPCALLFALRPTLSSWTIQLIGAVTMVAPGAIDFGWQPMSDIPFLLLTILSFGLLFRSFKSERNRSLLVLSGLVGGLAYSVRNVGIALFPTIVFSYGLLACLRILTWKQTLWRMVWWALGAAVIVAPLLVWNLVVFHSFQPYHGDPSTIGLAANIRYFLGALLADLTTSPVLIDEIIWKNKILVTLMIGVLGLIAIYRGVFVRFWREASPLKKETIVFLGTYFSAGAAVVIVARSRYEWGELIASRQLVQYDWLVLVSIALLFESAERVSRKSTIIALAAMTAIFGLRTLYASEQIRGYRQQSIASSQMSYPSSWPASKLSYTYQLAVNLTIARDAELIQAISRLPHDTRLISNYSEVIRVRNSRPVYQLDIDNGCHFPASLRSLGPGPLRESIVVLIFPTFDLLKSGCWKALKESPSVQQVASVRRPYMANVASGGVPIEGPRKTGPGD